MLDGQNDGNYTLMNIEAPPEAIQKITGEFRLNGDILRHLFVRVPAARTA
jgi:ribosomal protein S6